MPLRSPPKIKHIGRRPSASEADEIINACAKAMHLHDPAKRLLAFYTSQAENFRPALKLIERNTGIAANKVSSYRKELCEKGIIAYTGDRIVVDHERVRLFSTLDPDLTRAKRASSIYIAPVNPDPTSDSEEETNFPVRNWEDLSEHDRAEFTKLWTDYFKERGKLNEIKLIDYDEPKLNLFDESDSCYLPEFPEDPYGVNDDSNLPF